MSTVVEEIVNPYHQTSRFSLYEGDCRSVLPMFADCSFDSIVTDPPYELGFMGKGWDRSGIAYDVSVWRECLRVLRPGGHLLAFGGSRTYHRLACAIEDAGFEIRDQIQWLYGSGFPKSLNISKQIDLMEKDQWLDIKQLIEELDQGVIIDAWNTAPSTAELVDSPSLRSRVEVGFNTQRSNFVPVNALLLINPKRLPFNAIIAELQCCEAPPLSEENTASARVTADINTEALQVPAVSVEWLLQNPSLKRFVKASIAQCGVKVSLNGKTVNSLKDEEALKTWLGKKKCLERLDIDALCAGLIDGLKLTILNQSKTFQNLDTQFQTECVSAMIVTTTESTAASLISFTVDTLRSVAIDAAAGAEREQGVPGRYVSRRPNDAEGSIFRGAGSPTSALVTFPATEAGKQWHGWGTGLKPAHEPIVLARKPLIGTVAENVLRHGTGGLNIDGCRIPTSETLSAGSRRLGDGVKFGFCEPSTEYEQNANGRWPSNIIHDGSEEVLAAFPDAPGQQGDLSGHSKDRLSKGIFGDMKPANDAIARLDSGSAARFFYCAKASQEDRNEGCEDLPHRVADDVHKRPRTDLDDPRRHGVTPRQNNHPTVKPTELMRYLCRLITPPGGVVLDPFCGSGSTGKAAMLEGFKFAGIELNADYCQLAQRRIEAVTRQGLLFA